MKKELPPKTEQVLACLLTPLQEERYLDYLQSEQVQVALLGKTMPFKAIIRLRQICNHPAFYRGIQSDDSFPLRSRELVLRSIDGFFVKEEYVKKTPSRSTSATSNRRAMNGRIEGRRNEIDDENDENDENGIDYDHVDWRQSCKMIVLNEVLQIWKEEGHKVLIYTQTVSMLRILQNYAEEQVGCD